MGLTCSLYIHKVTVKIARSLTGLLLKSSLLDLGLQGLVSFLEITKAFCA